MVMDKQRMISESLKEELQKPDSEITTIQIRLFDDKTERVFYKQLSGKELKNVLGSFNESMGMRWF